MAQRMLTLCDKCASDNDLEGILKDRRGRGLFMGSENEAVKTAGWRRMFNDSVVCRQCQIEEEEKEKDKQQTV